MTYKQPDWDIYLWDDHLSAVSYLVGGFQGYIGCGGGLFGDKIEMMGAKHFPLFCCPSCKNVNLEGFLLFCLSGIPGKF